MTGDLQRLSCKHTEGRSLQTKCSCAVGWGFGEQLGRSSASPQMLPVDVRPVPGFPLLLQSGFACQSLGQELPCPQAPLW